jgi:hypothetical protein
MIITIHSLPFRRNTDRPESSVQRHSLLGSIKCTKLRQDAWFAFAARRRDCGSGPSLGLSLEFFSWSIKCWTAQLNQDLVFVRGTGTGTSFLLRQHVAFVQVIRFYLVRNGDKTYVLDQKE